MDDKFSKGFSLIEVLVVIGIIGIVATVAIPGWLSWRQNTQIRGAANNFIADLQLARIHAIREQTDVVLEITGSTTYQVFIGSCGDASPGSKLLRDRTLPAGVTIQQPTTFPAASGSECAGYNSRGNPRAGAANFLINGQPGIIVTVNVMGRIRKN